jgi:hypothetical protein
MQQQAPCGLSAGYVACNVAVSSLCLRKSAGHSIRASAPIRKQRSQVSAVDDAIMVEVNARLSSHTPCCEQDAEVGPVGRAALVEIGGAVEQQALACVDDAVLV